MTSNPHNSDPREHPTIAALIPWYVNGSIGEAERQRVDAHLQRCAECRYTLAGERAVYQGMNAEPTVEYMPAASLKRLQARLDGLAAAPAADTAADGAAPESPGRRSMPWQGLMAASVAVMALALSALAADRWMQYRAHAAPNYFTVTTAAARAPDEVIRAVFSPTITLVELQAILDEAGLRIISGPTEAGVYSLAAASHRPVNSSSLALLRANAKVRFAESTQPSLAPGHTP
jgi:anti-sigma-K factor RskA